LMAENEDQIDSFLSSHSDFEIMPIASVWDEVMESDGPSNKSGNKPGDDTYLRLTPAQHHTDGFFVAIMQRKQT
jgi:16S rRNA (cytosine967-C5)-methyltransferase